MWIANRHHHFRSISVVVVLFLLSFSFPYLPFNSPHEHTHTHTLHLMCRVAIPCSVAIIIDAFFFYFFDSSTLFSPFIKLNLIQYMLQQSCCCQLPFCTPDLNSTSCFRCSILSSHRFSYLSLSFFQWYLLLCQVVTILINFTSIPLPDQIVYVWFYEFVFVFIYFSFFFIIAIFYSFFIKSCERTNGWQWCRWFAISCLIFSHLFVKFF